jgi:hypothetical protein
MSDWLEDFQEKINEMTESTCLQFTAEVWGIEKDPEVKYDKLEVVNEKVFPYLDMEMRWNEKEELRFQVHMKPNQKLRGSPFSKKSQTFVCDRGQITYKNHRFPAASPTKYPRK